MANRYAKKMTMEVGIHCADTQDLIDSMLDVTPVGDIWGIGKEHQKLLLNHGFKTAGDLIKAPQEWIRKQLSVKGQRLLAELKGVSCVQWNEQAPPKKNICTSRSFGKLIRSKKEVQQAVASHTASCGAKLRKEGSCARKIHVFIQTNSHRTHDAQYFHSITLELPVATNSTAELIKYAMKALAIIYKDGYNYQKTGVIVMELVPASEIQLGLFDTVKRKQDEVLMHTVDNLNVAYGKDMVRFSTQGYGKSWKLRQEHLSQSYTTRFDQIKEVL
jgi:DNA polymerase V